MHRHPVRKQDHPQVLSPGLGNLGPEPEPPVFLFLLMFRILHHFSNPLSRDGRRGGGGEAGLCGAVWDLCRSLGADVLHSFESVASLRGEEVAGEAVGYRLQAGRWWLGF